MAAKNAASFDKLGTQVKGSFGGISQAMAALGLGLSIKEVIDYANSWEIFQNKLKAASTYSGLQARSLEDITKAASDARTPLEGYVTLYSRLMNAAGGLHLTELQVAESTDLISKAFKIGGSTAAQQAGGIIQITEALGTNLIQGRQLRALETDALTVSQALAAHFKTTVGGLKKLATEGKITGAVLIESLHEYKDKINAAFNATTVTISDAITKIDNAFTQFVGTQGESSGAIKALVDALTYLADNFQTIAPIVAKFVAVIAGALAAKAFVGFAGAVGEAVAALATFLGTIAAGEFTLAGFAAAMGPLALIVGAASVAFFLLNNTSSQLADTLHTLNGEVTTNESKIDLARRASVAYRADLGKQIATQIQAARAALEEAGAQYQVAQARAAAARGFSDFMNVIGSATGMGHDDRGSQYTKEIIDPALANINNAKAALARLKGQQNSLSWINMTKPGTADQAPGVGDSSDLSSKKGKSDPYGSAVQSIKDKTAALKGESAAQASLNPLVNDYGYALDKAKTSAELLAAAQKAGLKMTPELRASIASLAEGYAAADAASKKLAESQKEQAAQVQLALDTLKSTTRTFIDDLIAGKSAADALANALNNIGNKLLDVGFNALFGGGSGSSGSPLGAIGKLLGIGGSSGPSGGLAWAGLGHNAGGTDYWRGGLSQVGEHGGEIIDLPTGSRVIPHDVSMSMASGGGAVHAPVSIHIDASGADPAALQRVKVQLATLQSNLPATIVGAVRKARQQRTL